MRTLAGVWVLLGAIALAAAPAAAGGRPMKLTPGDIDIATRTVWAEARGEGLDGMVAVAAVLVNRWKARHRRESTLAGVATEPKQFSAWNVDDVNRAQLMSVGFESKLFRDAHLALMRALQGEDPTGGATYYHTLRARPRWSRGIKPTVVIGNHKFFAGIK